MSSKRLSSMIAFECRANFNLPYISGSITEYPWRRWHISLSGWFRITFISRWAANCFKVPRQMLNMLAVRADRHLAWCELELYLLGPLLFRAACHRKELFDEVPEKRQGSPHIYTLFLGGTPGLGAVQFLQRPLVHRCSRLPQPVVPVPQAAFRRCISCAIMLVPLVACAALLHPMPGRFWHYKGKAPPTAALYGICFVLHGVCGSRNGFHRTVRKL